MFILANLASGVTSLIPAADLRRPGRIDPEPFVAQIPAHRPTRIVASPALLERLADRCLAQGTTLSSLRKMFCGGAPVFAPLLAKLQTAFPGAIVTALYGSTEVEPIAMLPSQAVRPKDLHAMAKGCGLVGTPVSSIRLSVLPDHWGKPVGPYTRVEFAAVCLPPREAGEIVVSAPHVLSGHLQGQGDGETKFTVEGVPWHRTGDAGCLDDQGRLWLLGRCAARIVGHLLN